MSEPKFNHGDKVVVDGDIGRVTRYLDAMGNYFYQIQFDTGIDTLLYSENMLKPYKETPDVMPLPFDTFDEHGQFISSADYERKFEG